MSSESAYASLRQDRQNEQKTEEISNEQCELNEQKTEKNEQRICLRFATARQAMRTKRTKDRKK